MARVYPLSHVQALQKRAMLSGQGSIVGGRQVAWKIHGNCERPYVVVMRGADRDRADPLRQALEGACDHKWEDAAWEAWRPLRAFWQESKWTGYSAYIEIWTRCRKCPECLRQRARLWRARARSEIEEAPRTWFVTYTFNEVHRYHARLKARQLLRKRTGEEFEELSADGQFMLLHDVLARELTLMVKRLRKNSKARLRYAIVAEAHEDGFPHYHGLIHELVPGTVSERALRSEWRGHGLGYCEAKLVEDAGRGAAYVCKYLTKSSLARVRASQNYGKGFSTAEVKRTSGTDVKETMTIPPNDNERNTTEDSVVSSSWEGSPGEGTSPGGSASVGPEIHKGVRYVRTVPEHLLARRGWSLLTPGASARQPGESGSGPEGPRTGLDLAVQSG